MFDPEALQREQLVLLVRDLLAVNAALQARIEQLEAQLAGKSGGPPAPSAPRQVPAFVKPNRPPKEKKPRKKRVRGYSRRRGTPTVVVRHHPKQCSVCGRRLSKGWVHTRREVIEIPQAPVEIIQHQIMAAYCGVCNRREVARADLSGQVVGRSRVGVRLMSLIAYLDTVCRMPVRTIRQYLAGFHSLSLSEGEIVRVLQEVASAGRQTYEGLLGELRSAKVVNADETGAREDGMNGYVWSVSSPTVRYYERHPSRGAQVIKDLLGGTFSGTLVADFYAAYNWYPGPIQRCLVHLDRDLDELKEKHSDDPAVCDWVDRVLRLIAEAKEYQSGNHWERHKQRRVLQQRLEAIARPFVKSPLPQHTLAERIVKHIWSLFVFVENPDVPADNNAAERSIRPFVVLRKVSGGTRSKRGSHTQAVLLSLFGTWQVRGLDALQACRQMLTGGLARAPG